MDPFARKMWRAGLAFAALLASLAAAMTIFWIHAHPRCGDRVVRESGSHDRRWTATILERRCGEDAPFITQVNLREGGTTLQRGFWSGQANDNNVFTVEQDAAGAGVQLQWNDAGELTIACHHCDRNYVRRQDAKHGTLKISYVFP